jgi:hypothetical protein
LSIAQAATDYYGANVDGGFITGDATVDTNSPVPFLDTRTPGENGYSTESISLPSDGQVHDVSIVYTISESTQGNIYTPLFRSGEGPDSFEVTGVATPEPASMALALVAGMGLIARSRRRT